MRNIKCILPAIITLLFISTASAQISPPGLGNTSTAFWSAVGIRQKLDAKNSFVTYLGLGRISDPEGDANPFKKQSILVLNQEFYHKMNTHWQYNYALSYRRQNQYESEAPYELETPAIQQEFRIYGRLAYATPVGSSVKWTTTYRQEFRKFFTPDFDDVPDGFQLRSRFKTQVLFPLDTDKENSLMGSAEALFSISNDADAGWGDFAYKESRFCLYYCYSPDAIPVTFDIGYMNDLMGGHGHHIKDANYLALDIILENPF